MNDIAAVIAWKSLIFEQNYNNKGNVQEGIDDRVEEESSSAEFYS